MDHRQISRKAVRDLVALHDAEMKEAIGRGENPHQFALDQQDAMVENYMSGMNAEERTRFFEVYAEETNALTAQIEADTLNLEDETQRILTDTEKKNQSAENFGKVIGMLILAGLVWLFLSKSL